MFCHITQNRRGRSLLSHEIVINLIANTITQTGLKVQAALVSGIYPTGVTVSDRELDAVNLKRSRFHGDWNYTLLPSRKRK
jgi:Rhodopirellula transposase DDE domain